MNIRDGEQVAEYFAFGRPRQRHRANVRQPISNRIILPLLGGIEEPDAELAVTVPQALELIRELASEVSAFCRRADIQHALGRTAPGNPVEEVARERGSR